MPKYSEEKVTSLRKKCRERGISDCIGSKYLAKSTLIALLQAHDKAKKVPPSEVRITSPMGKVPQPSEKFPTFGRNEGGKEEDESLTNVTRILIGKKPSRKDPTILYISSEKEIKDFLEYLSSHPFPSQIKEIILDRAEKYVQKQELSELALRYGERRQIPNKNGRVKGGKITVSKGSSFERMFSNQIRSSREKHPKHLGIVSDSFIEYLLPVRIPGPPKGESEPKLDLSKTIRLVIGSPSQKRKDTTYVLANVSYLVKQYIDKKPFPSQIKNIIIIESTPDDNYQIKDFLKIFREKSRDCTAYIISRNEKLVEWMTRDLVPSKETTLKSIDISPSTKFVKFQWGKLPTGLLKSSQRNLKGPSIKGPSQDYETKLRLVVGKRGGKENTLYISSDSEAKEFLQYLSSHSFPSYISEIIYDQAEKYVQEQSLKDIIIAFDKKNTGGSLFISSSSPLNSILSETAFPQREEVQLKKPDLVSTEFIRYDLAITIESSREGSSGRSSGLPDSPIEEPVPHKKIRPPGVYSLESRVNVGSLRPLQSIDDLALADRPSLVTITLSQFREELNNSEFVSRFTDSVRKLMKYKLSFYESKYQQTRSEYSRVREKADVLQRQGVEPHTIKEMFPMIDFYAGFLVELKEMKEKIIHKLESISPEQTQKNLIDALENTDRGLASIIGREGAKDNLASQLYAFSNSYRSFTNSFNNICLLGSAGSGKTSLATVMAYVYSKSGILVTDYIKIVSRADLVAGYIGHTAPRTRGVLLETLEGVLLIDEAYQLASSVGEHKSDFGLEAITEIVNFLDKYIGMNVVIVAGYPKEMLTQFFPANEGLARRFPYRIILRNYTPSELTDVLIQFIENKIDQSFDSEVCNYLFTMISEIQSIDVNIFSNQAGDMLNLGSSIVKSIGSAYTVKWIDGNLKNNIPILREGFRDFLMTKGMILE
jgi:hypothetical protein